MTDAFASQLADGQSQQMLAGESGLSTAEAESRLRRFGPNALGGGRRSAAHAVFLRQFTSPIVLILIAAALLSFALHDATDATIILAIVLASGLLGFHQEYGASAAVEKLLRTVELKASVLRDGQPMPVPMQSVVPGDVVLLSAGSGVPADCRLLDAKDLFVNEAALTGESLPVEKHAAPLPILAGAAQRGSALFLGTHVVSGSARALVMQTGRSTEFGAVAGRLQLRPPLTEFEAGVRRFGYLLLEITLVLVIGIFACNVLLARPVLDSFLFALALAVGLTPQLLPAVISINLAHGARRMAAQRVIVKRLAAIENFGSMEVLCSDKTGTLTEGRVRVEATLDAQGAASERVLFLAYLNAAFETAFANPIDHAIRGHRQFDLAGWRKLDEVPYDFSRKRLSVLAEGGGRVLLVTKGALHEMLDVCTDAELADGRIVPIADVRTAIDNQHAALATQGHRTLGVAVRQMAGGPIDRSAEQGMTFAGLLALSDPPKDGVAETIGRIGQLGVQLKVITGDNARVAATLAARIGLSDASIITGEQLRHLGDDALPVRAQATDIFAEIEPNQKERIVRALRKAGHVVGYIGDGINDAPAMHAADVSISVQSAVDVAKEAADIVLLDKDLAVLESGIREGRRTFANTLKYVFMATSANFGNMFSMAGASLFLPFLPLLPKQILLTNLLTDLPESTIATDRVDDDWIARPRRWNLAFIRRFMITFGLISSVFDYLTFAALLWLLRAGTVEFRTGWFLESVVSAAMIVLVVRTRAGFLRSRPSMPLLVTTLIVVLLTLTLPYTPLAAPLELAPLPAAFLIVLALIVVAYVATAELAKSKFYRRLGRNDS